MPRAELVLRIAGKDEAIDMKSDNLTGRIASQLHSDRRSGINACILVLTPYRKLKF